VAVGSNESAGTAPWEHQAVQPLANFGACTLNQPRRDEVAFHDDSLQDRANRRDQSCPPREDGQSRGPTDRNPVDKFDDPSRTAFVQKHDAGILPKGQRDHLSFSGSQLSE